MASKSPNIFWTKGVTEGLSYVPGVDSMMEEKQLKSNLRQPPKKHIRKVLV